MILSIKRIKSLTNPYRQSWFYCLVSISWPTITEKQKTNQLLGRGTCDEIVLILIFFRLKSHLDVWKDNFSLVGDDKGHKLTEDGPRNYIMYGSGRVHCKHVYATMHLAPRHDIFQWALEYFSGMNLQDRVV